MQKRIFLLIFISCILLQGCMSVASNSADAIYNRYTLENSVNNQLFAWKANDKIHNDPQLKFETNIDVTSFENIILLTGQAPSIELSNKAMEVVSNIPHQQKIVNQIQITQPISMSQQMEDSWLTTKVTSQIIASAKLDPNDLKVITENDTVYLIGSLRREQAKQAIEIARNTEGVKKVVTLIYLLEPKIS